MIIEDIANLICSLYQDKTAKEVSRIFGRERKWAYSVMDGATIHLDYAFIAGLSSLGYELKLVRKESDNNAEEKCNDV